MGCFMVWVLEMEMEMEMVMVEGFGWCYLSEAWAIRSSCFKSLTWEATKSKSKQYIAPLSFIASYNILW